MSGASEKKKLPSDSLLPSPAVWGALLFLFSEEQLGCRNMKPFAKLHNR